MGYTSTFFPRISNSVVARLPNILLTYIWLVGITNATNLLDNMDGLAGGLSLITASFLSYFFWKAGNQELLWVSLALSGSVLGFLFFNLPPASIFMGDSGSLFLGFTLAVLAIAQQQQASNVFAVLGVPTLLFLLPILDTALVTFTRLLRGQSPALGGRDHTSHRLIAFGLSERQVLLVLYGVALFAPQSTRSFPARVDFVTSPGHVGGPDGRAGLGMPGQGPVSVITDLGCFGFQEGEMTLTSLHPGSSVEQFRANMGWEVAVAADLAETAPPTPDELRLIRDELDPEHLYI